MLNISKDEKRYTEIELDLHKKLAYEKGRASIIEEFEKLRSELHETAEMHIDGDYYLRDEWIDEYINNHIAELKGENNET